MKLLHTNLAPGIRQLSGALDMLPKTLQDDEVVLACFARDSNQEIVVAGYIVTKGHYEGQMAHSSVDAAQLARLAAAACQRDDCWVGGDTGSFYRDENDFSKVYDCCD